MSVLSKAITLWYARNYLSWIEEEELRELLFEWPQDHSND